MEKEQENIFYEKLKPSIDADGISCRYLLAAARSTGISGKEARSLVDARDINIKECQLGFFGWKEKNKKPKDIPAELEECIKSSAVDNTINCPALWACAASCGVTRKETGAAADALGLKARGCQLGIF